MDVVDAIAGRRSIGRLENTAVAAEIVRELCELAIWAPNHRLTEPWTFTVIEGPQRERLGRFWGAIEAERSLPEDAERAIERAVAKLVRAPTIVCVSVRTADDPIVAIEDFAAAAAATQNLLLAAHARGLGATWRTGAIAYDARVRRFLGLAETDRIVAFVYLGWPAPSTTERKSARRNLAGRLRRLAVESEAT